MIDTENGTIGDRNHELFGCSLKKTVLIFPGSIGSSVGAYSIFSLKINLSAPAAIICKGKADIVTASGCAISNIPLVDMLDETSFITLKPGMQIKVDADKNFVSPTSPTV
jgi:predicted aconitase with swiveling domain